MVGIQDLRTAASFAPTLAGGEGDGGAQDQDLRKKRIVHASYFFAPFFTGA